jgi:hypothetical protein
MFSSSAAPVIGNPIVTTLDYRGYNPEELADMAVDKIIHVGGNSHPVIVDQAKAYRENIRKVLVHYFALAQESAKTTVIGAVAKSGDEKLAEYLRRL